MNDYIPGVTQSVSDKINAVCATILREDGVMFRLCACGARHPVGIVHDYAPGLLERAVERHLSGRLSDALAMGSTLIQYENTTCCPKRCCEDWRG